MHQELLDLLASSSPARLSVEELAAVLASAKVLREENTSLAGMIRILDLEGNFFIQEETPEKCILVRPRPSIDAAMTFLDRRLQAYERMWDG